MNNWSLVVAANAFPNGPRASELIRVEAVDLTVAIALGVEAARQLWPQGELHHVSSAMEDQAERYNWIASAAKLIEGPCAAIVSWNELAKNAADARTMAEHHLAILYTGHSNLSVRPA